MRTRKIHIQVFIALILLICTNSCKTFFVPVEEKSIITPLCVQTQLLRNQLEYSSLSMRFSAEINSGGNSESFRGNIRILKDSIIWISVRSLNIEGARLFITPDSIMFINRIDNNYFVGDISSLRQVFNVDLDYKALQGLLTNSFFYYRVNNENENLSEKFNECISPGFYCIQSLQNFVPLIQNDSSGEINSDFSVVEYHAVQRVKVYPEIYKPAEVYIENRYYGQSLNVKYNNLFKINDSDFFPKNIELELISPHAFIELNLSVDNITIDRESLSFPFSIPDRYEPLIQIDR